MHFAPRPSAARLAATAEGGPGGALPADSAELGSMHSMGADSADEGSRGSKGARKVAKLGELLGVVSSSCGQPTTAAVDRLHGLQARPWRPAAAA